MLCEWAEDVCASMSIVNSVVLGVFMHLLPRPMVPPEHHRQHDVTCLRLCVLSVCRLVCLLLLPVKRRGRKPGGKNKPKEEGKGGKKLKPCKAFGCKGIVDTSRDDKGAWCTADKRAIDRLRFLAKSKNELKWWKDMVRDEDKLQSLLARYWETMGGRRKWDQKTPTAKFNLTLYIERMRTSSGVDSKRGSRFMWRKAFLKFRMDPEGGSYSEEQAQCMWDALLARKASGDSSLRYDFDGPREDRFALIRSVFICLTCMMHQCSESKLATCA